MDFKSNESESVQGAVNATQLTNNAGTGKAKASGAKKANTSVMLLPQKPVLNLDETIKLVEDLHRKKEKRNILTTTLLKLDNFVIDEERQEELEDSNYFTGCTLTIKDDNRKEFSTKNPVLIGEIVAILKEKILNKIIEVEAEIIIPAA
jgi:hypothetical protein